MPETRDRLERPEDYPGLFQNIHILLDDEPNLFGSPVMRRMGRENMPLPRGRRPSVLPYPRRPLSDLTAVVRAFQRRARMGELTGQEIETLRAIERSAQFEHMLLDRENKGEEVTAQELQLLMEQKEAERERELRVLISLR